MTSSLVMTNDHDQSLANCAKNFTNVVSFRLKLVLIYGQFLYSLYKWDFCYIPTQSQYQGESPVP